MRINLKDIEENVNNISDKGSIEFVYQLLLAYGKPNSSITRLKKGDYNLAKDKTSEIYWKSNIYFRHVEHEDLHSTIDDLKGDPFVRRHDPRFIIVTDYKQLLAIDTKTEETLDIPIGEIASHHVFFLPWAGMEKSQHKTENLADIRAAERMAKLYDEIIKHNESDDPAFYHALNVFFSRLLFCFFAEDTTVFKGGQFTSSIESHTQSDGSDLSEYLDALFEALDVEDKTEYPLHLREFPYVNGGLFSRKFPAPNFSKQARKLIIECGELDWAQINPDIFGSMIQAVVHPGQRAGLGMHYTSVVNIMKVIEPLFLEELLEEFDKAGTDEKKLGKLLHRIYSIKIFDPACGSGNFLIIAFKELRKLEHRILEILLDNKLSGIKIGSGLKLDNFYGIEIDDFAHEVAILSLWLAKHQMNIEFKKRFGKDIPLIPLKDTGNVVCDNATRVDWGKVCPIVGDEEIYIIGNPPYLGSSMQDKDQKKELEDACKGFGSYKNLDYISIWFIKASDYIKGNVKCAFVSTNSICQGDQVSLLWPHVLSRGIEIEFAHRSFKWSNSAKHNAGVVCVIVGLSSRSKRQKRLFIGNIGQNVTNINAYLLDGPNVYIPRRSRPLSNLPEIIYGNKPTDNGNLILSQAERDELIEESPSSSRFILKYMGSEDLIKGKQRYCLWIKDSDLEKAMEIPAIVKRLDAVSVFRKKSKANSTSEYANHPNRFKQRTYREQESIVIPEVSSERREYIPMDFIDKNTVISNKAYAIYGADIYVFGFVLSKMHMTWVKTVAGRLKSDLSYSSTIVYNNFPAPSVTEKQKQMIANNVYEVLDIREKHSEKTLAELYDPDKMPDDLRKAHHNLDEVVELCYRTKPFDSDEERLSYLFKLYETMITVEKEKN